MTLLFEEFLKFIVEKLDGPLWDTAIVLLLGVGLTLTFATKGIQFRLLKQSFKEMVNGRAVVGQSLTPFQAFATGLASRVGVGNISGVATAIAVGGPGAVFWMWVTSLIGMSSAIAESSLAQLYKRNTESGVFTGGPAYYILYGLRSKFLSFAFAIALIFTFGFAFNAVQANSIVEATSNAWGWNAQYVAVALVVTVMLIIVGGLKRVGKISAILVPLMALLYLIMAVCVVLLNFEKLPGVFGLILSDAFTFSAAGGGVLGAVVSKAMLNGIKRGLFSNEAGMGSAPNIAATADTTHPVKQGLIQMLGVFIDTILVCSATAFVILTSDNFGSANFRGVSLTQNALSYHLGEFGVHFLALMLLLFAFSSIIGNYSYAENNIKFVKNNKALLVIFRVMMLIFVYFGAIRDGGVVWSFADTVMAVMTIINLVALALLFPTIKLLLADYFKQYKQGVDPVFDLAQHEQLQNKGVDANIWSVNNANASEQK